MNIIDLRSDTVTHPTPDMRKAMYEAEVGDDGFGDDPTVIRLQELAAATLGKEAGLYVASGTMGNLIATLTHCRRGDEAIVGGSSHIVRHERGGMAALAGVFPRIIENQKDGTLDLDRIKDSINHRGTMYAPSKLICLENTWSGKILKPAYTKAVREIADQHGSVMHLDGARIFNAAVAQNKDVKELCSEFDSVQFCFSKGLSAPVGSMICGTKEFIQDARNNRQILGGTMRQVGVIAAPCIVALETMVDRLAEDHANAKRLAEGLAEFSELEFDPRDVETNIVFLKTKGSLSAHSLATRLSEEGVRLVAFDEHTIRAVTHYGIDSHDIDQALLIFKRVLQATKITSKS